MMPNLLKQPIKSVASELQHNKRQKTPLERWLMTGRTNAGCSNLNFSRKGPKSQQSNKSGEKVRCGSVIKILYPNIQGILYIAKSHYQ